MLHSMFPCVYFSLELLVLFFCHFFSFQAFPLSIKFACLLNAITILAHLQRVYCCEHKGICKKEVDNFSVNCNAKELKSTDILLE